VNPQDGFSDPIPEKFKKFKPFTMSRQLNIMPDRG
jgi:hypothetical protein